MTDSEPDMTLAAASLALALTLKGAAAMLYLATQMEGGFRE